MSNYSLEQLNQANRQTFIEYLSDVYEESPWVAERAWTNHPFSGVDELQQTMERVVEEASGETQLELLRAHPDLGENTEMTDASEQEQASAGLDQLDPELYNTFQRLNQTYQEQFDFPFIMAVKDENPESIRREMEGRIENTPPKEFRTALDEVHKIAQLRLEELLASD
ncbi:Uricase [Natrialba chahannaoensis JCM 10990]|uniref:2-oxo-4-hydroxy-4-carboxy-5-ureidoimidazoline decarboxylase n=1 Tax=Natrialba chahannaoensis JCM 10990 TaxID=1227492 RepID=M0B2Y6_9EURY|nr:2-oxo-4-hydroxy-4-carboxy-5-ureidoimidazoline decarboxylase [Natrialba chahannaoensis]ELZ04917.1 Uricase [Natrialba chahannaoensis JCM 10990]